MNLFEIIPVNLFSILNSKNKDIYVSSLFVIRQAFKQKLMIDKEVLVQELVTALAKEIINLDLQDEEQDTDISKVSKDATSLARFVIRRFKETGWIEPEYGVDTGFKEYIALPPYSVKLINVLYSIVQEDEEGYNTYMYSIYSNLVQADTERQDFMYAALLNAYERTNELENELKTLFHNIRRKHNKLSYLDTVYEVLVDHFDDYQKRIVRQVYMPLKTKDSLNRFKGNVIKILLKWMRDPLIIEQIEKQAMSFKAFNSPDEAKEDIITRIYFIVDKLNELEETIDKIDKKNKDYVSATTEKMRFLINKDLSIQAKMSKIIDKLSAEEDNDEITNAMMENIYLERNNYINETSLFVRNYSKIIYTNEPLPIDDGGDYEHIDDIASSFITNMNDNFSRKNIIAYVENKLSNKNELESSKFNIKNDDELILNIHSLIRGWDKNIFYKIDLGDGNVKSNNYVIPNMKYIRRRKI